MKRVNRLQPLYAAIVCALAAVAPAVAQQAPLEEIIVTAERRATSLQQTPISIAAFSAETMELKGVETIEGIATLTPNLDVKGSRGTGNVNPTYQIRGLSGGGGLGERSVAMYIDGIFMPRTTGPYMNVLDVERIEVLRGPQGTLFGRNSTGGAIRVFTKQPGPEREGYVRLTGGNFDRADVSAMVNVPLSDVLFLRLHGGRLSQDGYVRRGSQELGGSEDTLGRLQLAFEPSDQLKVTFGLSSTESKSDGNPQVLETFDMRPDLNFQGNRADWVSDFLEMAGQPRIEPFNDPRIVLDDFTMPDWCFLDDADPDWHAACEQHNRSKYRQLDVNLAWNVNDRWTISSVTGVSEFESSGVTDWVMLGTEARFVDVESDSLYQELQLNASFDRLELVTGVSYFKEDVYGSPGTGSPNYDRRGTSAFPNDANGNDVAVGSGPNGLFVSVVTDGLQKSDSIGVFTNLTWRITERLSLTPGLRYALDRKDVTETRFAADDFVPFGGAPSTTIFAKDDWDNTDWRLTLDYRFMDDHMLYVTSSEAYRSGGYSYNVAATSSGEAQTQAIAAGVAAAFTPPEKVRNDEIGFRTEWIDGRLRLNLTYFTMAYTNRQGPVQIPEPSLPTGFRIQLVNTGDVDLDGYEFDGQFAATPNFLVDFSAGFIDSKIKDPCANNGDFLFPGPVERSHSLGGRWLVPLQAEGELTIGLSYAYTGPQHTHPGGTTRACFNPLTGAPNVLANGLLDSRYELPGYGLTNARVRYSSSDGRWALTVFGNNLTDKVYANFATRFGGAFWDTPTGLGPIAGPERSALGVTRGRPRGYGVTFQYDFGGGTARAR